MKTAVVAFLLLSLTPAHAGKFFDSPREWGHPPTGADIRHNALRRAYCDAEFQTALMRAHFGQWTLSRGGCW
jgi:hypothetical protein